MTDGTQPVIVAADMLTPYGGGMENLWSGLWSGRTGIGPIGRFSPAAMDQVKGVAPPPVLKGMR